MITNHKLLPYALNKDNKWVYIEDVPNGLACNCHCPCCKESLIARNKGIKREHHFAHSSGSNCQGYYETTLHLLSKEIIKTEKAVMLPEYGYLESQQLVFEKVEVEERNDYSNLQPDCVGITKDGLRLHIEICVTHQIDDFKKSKIKEGNINCIEIRIPCDFPLDIKELKDFLLFSTESREWINYPFGDLLLSEEQKDKIIAYRNAHPGFRAILIEKCDNCEIQTNRRVSHETAKKEYLDFINTYQNRILPWGSHVTRMSPIDVVKQLIIIKYDEKTNAPYVWLNDRRNWVFPPDGNYTNLEHKKKCESTFDFFNKYIYICMNYLNSTSENLNNTTEGIKCKYNEAQYKYLGKSYVFCSYKS